MPSTTCCRRLLSVLALCGHIILISPVHASATSTAAPAVQPVSSESPSPGSPESASSETTSADGSATDDDRKIQDRLSRVLQASGWFENVRVRVDSGVVFLNGTTDDQQYFEWAESVSRNTDNVVAVINEITVQQRIDLDEAVAHVATSLRTLWQDFLKRLPLLIAGTLVLVTTWTVATVSVSMTRRMTQNSRLRISLQDLLAQLTWCAVWAAGLMTAAVVIFPGMTPARILTVMGLSSVAIGFAFKDIFENFFAGILILWRFPFDKGDFIQCSDIAGRVEDITIRMTQIRQTDGELVVVPNAILFKEAVHVMTNHPTRRVTVICGVAYGEDVDRSRRVIQEAVESCDSVDRTHEVEIFAREFASSSINFEVTWWTGSTPLDIRQSRDEVVSSVKRALDAAGIEIPFPYRTLTFKEPLPVLPRRTPDSEPVSLVPND